MRLFRRTYDVKAIKWDYDLPDPVKDVRWERQLTDDGEFLRPYIMDHSLGKRYLYPDNWIVWDDNRVFVIDDSRMEDLYGIINEED